MLLRKCQRRFFWFCIISFVLLVTVVNVNAQLPNEVVLASLQANAKLNNAGEILADFTNGKAETRVIITLQPSPVASALAAESISAGQVPEEFQKAGAPTYYNLQDMSIQKRLRTAVEGQVAKVISEIGSEGVTITNTFSYQFGFSAIVTPSGLNLIVNNPTVLLVEKDRLQHAHLAQGIPLINAVVARSTYSGSGVSIAITDTGIDTSHPRLGGSSTIFNSKVIGGYDTGDNDADPRPGSGGTAHGTACAGIAGGNTGTVGDYIGGVAPGVKLYALKISFGTGGSAYDSDTIEAWNWIVTHRKDDPNYPIKVISHSFGGGRYYSACDTSLGALTTAAASAVAAGITIFASSGNDGFCNSMGGPACISWINSVGAVFDGNLGSIGFCVASGSCIGALDSTYCVSPAKIAWEGTTFADKVTSYSNSASFLTMFAPSHNAYTADIVGAGGYSAGSYDTTFGGTSAACPYAAGAAAVLQSAAKAKNGSYLTPAQVRQYLVNNGNNVTDSKVAVTKPRINLGNAVTALIGLPLSSGFPWPMFRAALSKKVSESYWSALSYVYCPTSAATFSLTSSGVTKKSVCQGGGCAGGSGTFEGWVTTAPGSKSFSWSFSASTCGTWTGSFNYTLAQGTNYQFFMNLNASSQPTVYVASGSGKPFSTSNGVSTADLLGSSVALDGTQMIVGEMTSGTPKEILSSSRKDFIVLDK